MNFTKIAAQAGITAKKGAGYGIKGTGYAIEKTGWGIKKAGEFIESQGRNIKLYGDGMVQSATALGIVMKGEADLETCKRAGLSDEDIAAYFGQEQEAASEKPQKKAKTTDPKNGIAGDVKEGEELSPAQCAEMYA